MTATLTRTRTTPRTAETKQHAGELAQLIFHLGEAARLSSRLARDDGIDHDLAHELAGICRTAEASEDVVVAAVTADVMDKVDVIYARRRRTCTR